MGSIHGQDRHQQVLFPVSLDDYIDAAHPIRFLAIFVHGLDLQALGFTHATPNQTGRPSSPPGARLKLYLSGYVHKIRSSRKFAHESQRNRALMWLLQKLTPDCQTIADVRKAHSQALKGGCSALTVLCQPLALFGRERIAIAGSTGKAVNSTARHCAEKKLQHLLKHIKEKIDAYLKELDKQATLEARTTPPPYQYDKKNSSHDGHSTANTTRCLRPSISVKLPRYL
jgi:transposase